MKTLTGRSAVGTIVGVLTLIVFIAIVLLGGGTQGGIGIMDIFLGLLLVVGSLAAVAGFAYMIPHISKLPSGKSVAWIIGLLTAVGLTVLGIWGLQGTHGTLPQTLQAPTPKYVWSLTKDYWLWALILFGVAYAVLSSRKEDKEKAAATNVLKNAIVLLVVLLFVVNPFVVWVWGEKPTFELVRQTCQPYSSTETHQCLVPEEGVTLSTAESIKPGEFEFCFTRPKGAEYESHWLGPNTLRVRSKKGIFPLVYRMVRRDTLVNGQCPAVL